MEELSELLEKVYELVQMYEHKLSSNITVPVCSLGVEQCDTLTYGSLIREHSLQPEPVADLSMSLNDLDGIVASIKIEVHPITLS